MIRQQHHVCHNPLENQQQQKQAEMIVNSAAQHSSSTQINAAVAKTTSKLAPFWSQQRLMGFIHSLSTTISAKP